jgi:hypothetical protein
MSCELTSGFEVACRESTGGIKNFYIGQKTSDLSVTTDSSGIATSITGAVLYKYNPRRETSMFNDEVTTNEQNGSVYYAQTAQIILTRMEQRKRNEVVLLAKSNLIMIVQDQNDKYWLLGEANGITLANSPGGSGTAYADRNGYELNFEGAEPTAAREVEADAFSDLIQPETGES